MMSNLTQMSCKTSPFKFRADLIIRSLLKHKSSVGARGQMAHFKNYDNPLLYSVVSMATKSPMLKYGVFFLRDKNSNVSRYRYQIATMFKGQGVRCSLCEEHNKSLKYANSWGTGTVLGCAHASARLSSLRFVSHG